MSDLKDAASAPPLSQRPVSKAKVWTVLCGGAAGLFALTILAENSKTFFPAISRANDALASQKTKAEEQPATPGPTSDFPPTLDQVQDTTAASSPSIDSTASSKAQDSSEEAVLAGLQAARERSSSKATGDDQPSQAAESKLKP